MKVFRATNTLDKYLIPHDFTENKAEAEVIIVGGKPIILEEFPLLRGIFKTGVGTDNLPFEQAEARGIQIRLPSEQTKTIVYDETAAFSCYLIMQGLYVDEGDFATWTKRERRSLSGKKLLVMGAGKIGSRVISSMSSLMKVDLYDPLQHSPDILPELIRDADCISLHMPLNELTRDFFNKERLAMMKDGSLLVNTSRGPIVNESDLFNELSSGRIYAAFDVFWEEPYKGILLQLPGNRFIRTPHIASTCEEFLEGLTKDLIFFCTQLESK